MSLLNFERPGADFSIYACLYSLSNTHQANFTKIQQNNKIGMQWKLYIIIFSHDKKMNDSRERGSAVTEVKSHRVSGFMNIS